MNGEKELRLEEFKVERHRKRVNTSLLLPKRTAVVLTASTAGDNSDQSLDGEEL